MPAGSKPKEAPIPLVTRPACGTDARPARLTAAPAPRRRSRARQGCAAAPFLALAFVFGLSPASRAAADPRPLEPMDGGEIAHALHRLQSVGSALYVGAHPDDENTALLAWLTHVKGVRAAYLSMTRGDGGPTEV